MLGFICFLEANLGVKEPLRKLRFQQFFDEDVLFFNGDHEMGPIFGGDLT